MSAGDAEARDFQQRHRGAQHFAIRMDDGTEILAAQSSGDEFTDQTGRKHSGVRMVPRQVMDKVKSTDPEGKFHTHVGGHVTCNKCEHSFRSQQAYISHAHACTANDAVYEDFSHDTVKDRAKRRRNRIRGTKGGPARVEQIHIQTLNGTRAEPCGSFKYLGTIINKDASAGEEVQARINAAKGTFGSMHKVWDNGKISDHTKGRLFSALVISILLYNAETWPLLKGQLKALKKQYQKMYSRLQGPVDTMDPAGRLTNEQCREKFKVPDLEPLLTEKRLRWVGHSLRRDEGDISRSLVTEQLHRDRGTWRDLILEDLKAKKIKATESRGGKIDVEALRRIAEDRATFRHMTSHHTQPE